MVPPAPQAPGPLGYLAVSLSTAADGPAIRPWTFIKSGPVGIDRAMGTVEDPCNALIEA